jgi:hypothetical protein
MLFEEMQKSLQGRSGYATTTPLTTTAGITLSSNVDSDVV